MKKISFVIACYNEAKNIRLMYERITAVMQQLPNYAHEIIFVDNASTDSSMMIFHELVQGDAVVHVICMARNFGSSQPSFWAGINYATGDCIIPLDGDLQDPPEVVLKFVQKWEEGFEVVYGIREKRKGGIIRRIGYACFYRVFKWLSYIDIPLDAGDFSLIDRKVIEVIKYLPEKDLYIRGLRAWAGFKQIGVSYARNERYAGKTSNSFLANFAWAKKAIVNFSYKPLEFISRLAFMAVVITMFAACFYLYLYFIKGAPQGFPTLLMVMFIFGTIQLLALSVIGEYLLRIFQEVKGRPPYVVREILEQRIVERDKGIRYERKNNDVTILSS
jgi:dolichol-phosphate mannosyltransferase